MDWKCGDFIFPLGMQTYIMGILNVTPDSFSDGGKWSSAELAAAHAMELEEDGADIIDIGAQSTRPGHVPVTADEEWARLEPVLKTLAHTLKCPISVDTYYPEVAQKALDLGAAVVNDVSGVMNPLMAAHVAQYRAGWVVMHTGGGTADITADPNMDIITSVNQFFSSCLAQCGMYALDSRQICLDMGIGFGKTPAQNLILIQRHRQLLHPDNALLTGLSRKRIVGQLTGIDAPDQRLPGNIAAHTCAIMGGTDILRVHDVKAEKAAARMADALLRG